MNNISNRPGIYSISNTETHMVYIGSAVNIKRRIRNHIYMLKIGSHFNPILQNSFNKNPNRFECNVIEIVEDKKHLLEREQYWIDTFRTVGNLYNILLTAGNSFGKKASEETKIKMSQAMKGKNKGKIRSDEEKEHLSEIQKGKPGHPVSEKTKKQISNTLKGHTVSSETREKIREKRKYQIFSNIDKKRISEGIKQSWQNEERRLLLSQRMKGNTYRKVVHCAHMTEQGVATPCLEGKI